MFIVLGCEKILHPVGREYSEPSHLAQPFAIPSDSLLFLHTDTSGKFTKLGQKQMNKSQSEKKKNKENV